MELERRIQTGSNLSLKWNGDLLSTEASMTCFILACCRCDRVPVLLFIRPYASRRRWTSHGETYLADPPPADAIPQWPMNIFADDPADSHEGVSSRVARRSSPRLSPNIDKLRQLNIISTELDGEHLFFRMIKDTREDIWEQTSTTERLLLWFDLLKLIIHSVPEIYAEISWHNILRSCKPVIDSTILPFLSVLEWTQLQHHRPMIPRLLSFLLYYSIFSGFSVDTCIYLAPGPLRHIESSGNLLIKKMIELLKWKESLCLQLLQLQDKDQKCPDVLEGASLETAELNGILGFLIASVLKSSKQTLRHMDGILAIAQGWLERQGPFYCTMAAFAQHLLSMDGPSNQSSRLSYILGKADTHVKFTMAMAMIERDNFAQAYSLLLACAEDLRFADTVYVNEYFLVMTELVKCCNILNKEEQGEETALGILQHPYSYPATPNQIHCIQIALVDSLIGRSKYSEANELLENILTNFSLSPYLTTVASLRLNKVRRRLDVLNISAFSHKSALREALTYVNSSSDHIRDEVLEELSCTISYTQQRKTENTAAAKAVIDNASTIVAGQPIYTSNWRTGILHEQLAYASEHTKQDEQSYHQNLSKSSSTDASILATQCGILARDITKLSKLYNGADFPDSMIQATIQSLNTMELACNRIQLFQDSILTDDDYLAERLKQTIEAARRYLDALEYDVKDTISFRPRAISGRNEKRERPWQAHQYGIRGQAQVLNLILQAFQLPKYYESHLINEGVLNYKGPGLKGLIFLKKYFWFGDGSLEHHRLFLYLSNLKDDIKRVSGAYAGHTGKDFLFYAKRAEDKDHPQGIFCLADVTDVVKGNFNDFGFSLNGHQHIFQATNKSQKDAWLITIEIKAAEAKIAREKHLRQLRLQEST